MKKVFKGWIPKYMDLDEIIRWEEDMDGSNYYVKMKPYVEKLKKDKLYWSDYSWVPKRVTITVEVEE